MLADSLQDETILVTGATGFIGGALCERLLKSGARVRGLGRNPSRLARLTDMGVEAFTGDITDHARMAEVVQGTQVVFHLAAHTGGTVKSGYVAGNVEATRHLAEASAAAGVERFVYTSSIAAIGFTGDDVVDEMRPLKPYGDSKIGAERALRDLMAESEMGIVITRPGMVYGPRSMGWSVRALKLVRSGVAPLIGGGRGTSYPIFIDNLIDGLLLCATHPDAPGETFNFVDDPVTWAAYFGGFAAMLEPPGKMRRVPRWFANLGAAIVNPFVRRRNLRYAADMLGSRGVISNQKAKDVLGWEPRVSFEEGMRRTEPWLQQAGYLSRQ